jgi:hypothetical protein
MRLKRIDIISRILPRDSVRAGQARPAHGLVTPELRSTNL